MARRSKALTHTVPPRIVGQRCATFISAVQTAAATRSGLLPSRIRLSVMRRVTSTQSIPVTFIMGAPVYPVASLKPPLTLCLQDPECEAHAGATAPSMKPSTAARLLPAAGPFTAAALRACPSLSAATRTFAIQCLRQLQTAHVPNDDMLILIDHSPTDCVMPQRSGSGRFTDPHRRFAWRFLPAALRPRCLPVDSGPAARLRRPPSLVTAMSVRPRSDAHRLRGAAFALPALPNRQAQPPIPAASWAKQPSRHFISSKPLALEHPEALPAEAQRATSSS